MTAKYKFKNAWVGASQMALGVENPPANAGDTRDLGSIPWRRKWEPTPVFFPHSSVGKESAFNAGDPTLIPGWGRPPWRRDRLPTPVLLGFLCGSAGKESTCNVEDLGLIPGLGRSPGEGKGYPLQYAGLENSMYCIVYRVTKSWT